MGTTRMSLEVVRMVRNQSFFGRTSSDSGERVAGCDHEEPEAMGSCDSYRGTRATTMRDAGDGIERRHEHISQREFFTKNDF